MRRKIPLNFDWFYRADFDEAYLKNEASLAGFEPIALPHANKILPYNNFSEQDYQFVSSYRRILTLPPFEKGDHILLEFGAVMTVACIYLNEKLLKVHEGGFTPFTVEITEEIKPNAENFLFVKVDSREIKDIPPFGNIVDYLCYGGIYREVSLSILPPTYIDQAFIKTKNSPKMIPSEMIFDLSLHFQPSIEKDYSFILNLSKEGKTVFSDEWQGTYQNFAHYSMIISDIERWTLDHPVLYHAEIIMKSQEEILDTLTVRFGFRTAEFTPKGFLLNDIPIKLIGLNRHQSYPYVGFAMPRRIQEKDAEILKNDLGCNIVRTSHYMQSDHFINRCDELGLLVFEEIPGWQYIGNEHFKELSFQNLQDMILAHFNHPSIVLWGVRINESPDDDDFYAKTNDIARTLDTSRQTAGVRNMKHSHFFEDVYTYNDFVHTGKNEGLTNPRKVTKGLVPYMVTEYNGHIFPTKKFDNEQRRLDHAMRHLAVQEANFKYESCSGAIGWCMNDYNTHSEFGSGDRICYHGVMDMFRIPKYAAAVYASQQRKHPVLTVASNMTMGEYNESSLPQTIIFTNCDYVKVYKNNHYIGTFYSSWDTYPSIPYPPVIVDDYIGDLLKENEKYSPKVANSIKKVLLSFQKNGMNLPLSDKLRVLKLIIVNKLDMIEGEHLFGKYIGNWGQDGGSYRYEGYMDDVPLISVSKGAATQAILVAEPDDLSLHPQDTYDATRIVVRLLDEFGNDRPFASNILSITSSSELAIIGPCQLSLIGGSVGIYVKTTGLLGKGTVRISSPGFSDIVVNIEVK